MGRILITPNSTTFLKTTITSSNPNDQSLNKCTEIYNEVFTAALDNVRRQGKPGTEINIHGSTETSEMDLGKEENSNENG